MLSLSSQGLSQIYSICWDKDFEFHVGGHKYLCSRILASFLSPLIAKQLSEDPLNLSFTISVNDDNYKFQLIINLMNGQEIKLDDSNIYYLLFISKKLENIDMMNDIIKFQNNSEELNLTNVISRTDQKTRYGIDASSEIDFLASKISEVKQTDLYNLLPSTLEYIFKSPFLRIPNESWLFQLILDIVHLRGPKYNFLFGSLYLEFLTENEMSTLLREISPDDIGGDLWLAIRNRLCLRVFPSINVGDRHIHKNFFFSYQNQNGEFHYDPNHPMEGILNHLTKICQENVHIGGSVEIIGSSSYSGCLVYTIADQNFSGFWISENRKNQWIKFDFKTHSIKLTGYLLKTRDGSRSDAHLRSWIIEGSHDGIAWEEIDKQSDNDDLNNNFALHYYECSAMDAYRMLRLKQTGKNHRGDYHLILNHIEFFGTLLSI